MHSDRAGSSAASSSPNLLDTEKPDGSAHAGIHPRVWRARVCKWGKGCARARQTLAAAAAAAAARGR